METICTNYFYKTQINILFLLKLVKEVPKISSLRELLFLRTTCWSYQNMLKVIRHPPRFSLDPMEGLRCLQDHQLSFLITVLSGPILEHEGMGAIFLKKGNIKSRRAKTDKKKRKIGKFLTLYETGTRLGAISKIKNKNQIFRKLVLW